MTDEHDAANAFFIEAFAPENRADPYGLYRRMRETGSVVSSDIEMHLVFGHAECWSILRSTAVSNDERRSAVIQREALHDPRLATMLDTPPLLVFMDPPDHTRLRGLVAQGFTPRRVERLSARIQALTDSLIDDLEAHGEDQVDIIEQFAYPLPIAVICELLGIPIDDHERFREWSAALTKSVDPAVLRTDDDNAAIERATADLDAYTGALLDDRRAHPGDDLLSDLASRHDGEDRLHDGELTDLVTLLLVAGHETTVNLIGNGLVALFDHPEQLADWAEHPDIANAAVDELLRFDSPLQMVQRVAIDELVVGGRRLPPGDQVIVMLGAANRDPAMFDDPDRLDLRRRNAGRHVSFGGGIHHCLGASLARVEGAIAVTSLLQRFPRISLAGAASIRDTFNLRGRSAVPVHLGEPSPRTS
jgi:pimeloyl-[acyl-carrier protein] synthase